MIVLALLGAAAAYLLWGEEPRETDAASADRAGAEERTAAAVEPAAAGEESSAEVRGEVIVGEQDLPGLSGPSGAGAPTRPLAVLVRLAETLANDAAPVPNVEVVVGVAPSQQAVEGAIADERLVLGGGTVDEAGLLRLSLDVPEGRFPSAEDEELWVYGHSAGAGIREWRRGVLVEDFRGETTLKLIRRTGITLRGRVIDRDSVGVKGAEVRLLAEADVEGGWKSAYGNDYTEEGGVFELHHDEEGTFALLVLGHSSGSAFREGIELAFSSPPEDVILTLSGSGTLAGTVVDPSGQPVAQHQLWALPSGWQGPHLNTSQRIARVRAGGSMDVMTNTDHTGAFRMTGLREGDYHIWSFDGPEKEYSVRLTESPVATGSEKLRFVVERHALAIKVYVGDRLITPRVSPRYRFEVRKELTLLFAKAGADGKLDAEESYFSAHHVVAEDGTVVFDVDPAQSYVLGVISSGQPLVEQMARADLYHREIVFRLPESVEPGVLELAVWKPDGEPFDDTTNVTVASIETSAPLHETDEYFEGPDFRAELPPGRYLVTVDAKPATGHHGEVFKATPFTPVEIEVVLRAGELSSFDLHLGPSGRLFAKIDVPDGWDEFPDDVGGDASEQVDRMESTSRTIGGTRIELIPKEGGATLQPVFDVSYEEGIGMTFLGGVQTRWAPRGVAVTSMNSLPVGKYTARLTSQGCVPIEREIEIRDGETVRLVETMKLRE